MANKKLLGIKIPEDLRFEALELARSMTTGDIAFNWRPIHQLCEASGIDPAIFTNSHEDNVARLIVGWYAQARAAGEPPDLIAEELIAETLAEDTLGGDISHPPGTA